MGTDNIKKALSLVIKVGEDIGNGLADNGKIDISEYIGIGVDVASGLPSVIKSWGDIKSEFKDLTIEERNELIEWAVSEFDISQDDVEQKIEKGIELINSIVEFIGSF